ncbi:hypothetical protein [Streptomyces sp. NPDC052042]|uniref:hypothetical protein n=1 Tax=Streptomyces sp. NPDC052042 TaxID=3365683 RepID=UPI0037D4ADDB
MPRNLADVARAALTAACVRSRGDATGPGGYGDIARVADTCVRGGLGFVQLLHRRKDGILAEELYFSTREDDGSWAVAEHLSGSTIGDDPGDPRNIAAVLRGRPLALLGESEALLYTGRPEADDEDGYEMLRFHTLLVPQEAGHLDIEDVSSGVGPTPSRTRKPLSSRIALFALFPGERFSVHVMAGEGGSRRALGEPWELTGTAPGPG